MPYNAKPIIKRRQKLEVERKELERKMKANAFQTPQARRYEQAMQKAYKKAGKTGYGIGFGG